MDASRKSQTVGGSLGVGRNASIGGDATIQGSLRIGHNIKIEGSLEASNIKDTNKGIFATVDKLRAAYPEPRDGWSAAVGGSSPFAVYLGEAGQWVATGGTMTINFDSDALAEETANRQQADAELAEDISDLDADKVDKASIAQSTGNSTTEVMSQKAVTTEISALRTALTLEESARGNGDGQLEQAISVEASQRASDDNKLRTAIDGEISLRKSEDDTLRATINAEISAREYADRALEDAIGDEERARTAADNALQQSLMTEQTVRSGETSALRSDLISEAATRTADDQSIRSDMNSRLAKKFDKESVKQVSGDSETEVMSQGAVTYALGGKVDKSSIVSEAGDSETEVMSQKATTAELEKKCEAYVWAAGVTRPFNALVSHNGVLYQVVKKGGAATEPTSDNADYQPLGAVVVHRYEENPEYIYAYTDNDGRFLFGISPDGSVQWAKGIPAPIASELERLESNFNALAGEDLSDAIETVKEILAFLEDVKDDEKLLGKLAEINARIDAANGDISALDARVEIVEGKTEELSHEDNQEFAEATIDANGKVLEGIKTDGTKYFPNKVQQGNIITEIIDNPEYSEVITDTEGKVLEGTTKDGQKYLARPSNQDEQLKKEIDSIGGDVEVLRTGVGTRIDETETRIEALEDKTSEIEHSDNPEYATAVADADGKVLAGIKKDGSLFLPNNETYRITSSPEYLHCTIDTDGRVLSGVDADGVMHDFLPKKIEKKVEAKGGVSIYGSATLDKAASISLIDALEKNGVKMKQFADWSSEDFVQLPMPTTCAKVNIIIDGNLPTVKGTDKAAEIEFFDKCGNYFRKPVLLNPQGSSSMGYSVYKDIGGVSMEIGKNLAFDLADGSEIKFGGWVAQDSFHLKLFYIDVFKGICDAMYKYTNSVISHVGVRVNRFHFGSASAKNGTGDFAKDFHEEAMCQPDGFPFELYVNGEYVGLRAWNLKKHRANYSMNKNDYKSVLLDGVLDNNTLWGGSVDWTAFELRNPKTLICMDGTKYDADTNCNELIDSTSEYYDTSNSVHVKTAQAKAVVMRLAGAMANIDFQETDEAKRAKFEEYFDKDSFVLYVVLSNVLYNVDGFRKNWIWTVYDNGLASPTFYDMDSLFGRNMGGNYVISNSETTMLWEHFQAGYNPVPSSLIRDLYLSDCKSLYSQLRDNKMISVNYITSFIKDWMLAAGADNYKKTNEVYPYCPSYRDGSKEYPSRSGGGTPWGGVPEAGTNGMYDSINRIKAWLTARIEFLDRELEYTH